MYNDRFELKKILFKVENGREPNKIDLLKIRFSLLLGIFSKQLKETAAVVSGKRLPDNIEYEGAPRVSQEMVEENPRRWIIEECVPACQILWDKNIYTYMCSDALDRNAWIELEIECLSSENRKILEELKKEYNCYQYHYGCLNIEVNGKGKKAQQELMKIAQRFVLQDVPSKYALYSMDDIYIECGCFKKISNPNYKPLDEQMKEIDFSNWGALMEEPYIIVVDYDKVVEDSEYYISKVGAYVDPVSGKIYRSKFHYNKHLNYINKMGIIKK